jgi:hypothetical protein
MKNAMGKVALRVRLLSADVMADARHVTIRADGVEALAAHIRRQWDVDTWPDLVFSPADTVVSELAASAVNYAFWYGGHTIRPGRSGASEMYRLLEFSAGLFHEHGRVDWAKALPRFAAEMSGAGFPHSEQRARHLVELLHPLQGLLLEEFGLHVARGAATLDEALMAVLTNFPGYAGDPFAKRLILFAMQVHRRLSLWDEEIEVLPVAADYQLPRMLRHHCVLEYSRRLRDRVDSEQLVVAGSREECEIRAATVLACDQLAKLTNLRPSDIDAYLWLRRDEPAQPFHLTLTTHY